jgi:dTMP kinase
VTGRFLVLEGGEACGKSTQAARLAGALDAVLTREPGGTDLGGRVRALLLDPATGALDPRTEALMMIADRAQHVAEVIGPALAAGRHVVSDRHVGSTIAYQGGGRGLDADELQEVSDWAAAGCRPDLVLLLDVPVEVAHARLRGARDRLEREDRGFHRRVRASFLAQAAADPGRWAVIDAAAGPDDVWEKVGAVVAERLGIDVSRSPAS